MILLITYAKLALLLTSVGVASWTLAAGISTMYRKIMYSAYSTLSSALAVFIYMQWLPAEFAADQLLPLLMVAFLLEMSVITTDLMIHEENPTILIWGKLLIIVLTLIVTVFFLGALSLGLI